MSNKIVASIKRLVNRFLSPVGLEIIKSKNKILDLQLYEHQYVNSIRYINIGAGDFKHPYWHNLDIPNEYYSSRQKVGGISIYHDLTSAKPMPVISDSIGIVYTSHVIEHLQDKFVEQMFNEVYRILDDGGIFRITCPDIDVLYDAYIRNDHLFWSQKNIFGLNNESIHQLFLEQFSTAITAGCLDSKLRFSDKQICEIFSNMDPEEAYDFFTSKISSAQILNRPEFHVNWFNSEKIIKMLVKAGFNNIYKSAFGQSHSAILRNSRFFDNTCPNLSLYIECRK